MITKSKARRLCSKAELGLVEASLSRDIGMLNTAELKKNVKRARKLRDKYRSAIANQRREMLGKKEARRARSARPGENTKRKAKLFAETLNRFEKQLAS